MFHSGYIRSIIEAQADKSEVLKRLNYLSFPDIEPDTFGLLVHYMYTEQIEDQPGTIAESADPKQVVSSNPLLLVKL